MSGEQPAANGATFEIPLSSIHPSAAQPRKHFEVQALSELASSIKLHGILQPLIVSEREDGDYDLVAGERRFRASKMAGRVSVPAVVRKLSSSEKLEIALIENLQREDLNPLEEAFAYKRLMDEFKLSVGEVAKRIGKAQSTVSNTLRLLNLPQPVQKALQDGSISMGKARALLGLASEQEILDAFASMTGKKISVREVERTVLERKTRTHGAINRDPVLFSHEEALRKSLGTKVEITHKKGKGKIIINYYSDEELKRLLQMLKRIA